ncbi:MAG: hypothetical protein JSV74_06620 [Dehalococcoidia bacterium]|nr:MAG: hypothetical protein JSV74_06620 [Dehalococcoidia bacterium]
MYHETQCGCGKGSGMDYIHRKWRGHHSISCCCCHPKTGMHHGHGGLFVRYYTSKQETIAKLEEYLKQLQSEAKGVEEHIAQLKKES